MGNVRAGICNELFGGVGVGVAKLPTEKQEEPRNLGKEYFLSHQEKKHREKDLTNCYSKATKRKINRTNLNNVVPFSLRVQLSKKNEALNKLPSYALVDNEVSKFSDTDLIKTIIREPAFSSQVAEVFQKQFAKFFQELEETCQLEKNWDSYGAAPPNETSIYWARQTLDLLVKKNFLPTRVVPSVEEGIAIVFKKGKKYADIEFFNTGEIAAIYGTKESEPVAWDIPQNINDIETSVDKIREYTQS